jgi:CheY-like chemotaxis protein
LAEDHPTNQLVAQLLLSRLGYHCTTVANGLEALATVAREHFDVILLDVQMPELDGMETARRLCAEYVPGKRPWIIAMTANALEGDREACLAAGMDDYLVKPIRSADLAAGLANAHSVLIQR